MAVPAHDERDFEFANAMNLDIVPVVMPTDPWLSEHRSGSLNAPTDNPVELRKAYLVDPGANFTEAYCETGVAVNSDNYDGLETPAFKEKITEDLDQLGLGQRAVNYKLRDWLFSRQRYWGEPFPLVHCEHCGTVGLPEDQLPLLLPEMDDFTPASSDDPKAPPQPPLGKATDWVNTTCPSCGGRAKRELNTMPQWAGSCWYYLRYLDPENDSKMVDPKSEKYWMGTSETNPLGGVDLYVGGAEHAVLHLLYARFWHKVLYDLGHVSSPEPFYRLFNQGMITSFTYRDSRGVSLPHDQVDTSGDKPVSRETGEELKVTIEKMSKSLRNVVNPDDVIEQYGADTFRLYEMFMGPLDASKPWNTRDVPGVHRFLQRVWRMVAGSEDHPSLVTETEDPDLERSLHKLIRKVGEDYRAMKLNTAIAAMMEFVNAAYKTGGVSMSQARRFVLLLAPLAPHICEELWQMLGGDGSLAHEPWPQYDESMIVEDTVELPVQVNGKLRSRISAPADADQNTVAVLALEDEKVRAAIGDKTVVKQIVVPGRLVNLVVK